MSDFPLFSWVNDRVNGWDCATARSSPTTHCEFTLPIISQLYDQALNLS
ncbi:hypothetical protein PIIN_07157 [Serendipita indica DSM 11827]|uniref:Uncharacterized protein n=1 Tax=Serendipita indica (strain DSM 11827) TaxID=1109443 RepID=G4TPG0_SERID|nr:hypothetical protein PIIN_07157 [Serendipita indica DSM 11827]